MSFLKGLAASILNLLLFTALSAFGFLFVLNATALNPSFVNTQINRLDIPAVAEQFISQEVGQVVPGQQALQKTIIKNTVTDLQPWVKEQAALVVNTVEAYFKGDASTISVTIPLDRLKQSLAANTQKAVQQNPPPEIAGLPPAQATAYINQFADQLTSPIPASFTLDRSSLGRDTMSVLQQIRQYTSKAQLIMVGLVLAMLLMIVLLYLLNQNIKRTSRDIGVTLLITGVIDYASIWLANKFSPDLFNQMGNIPDVIQTWLVQLTDDLTQPAITFAIAVGIVGALLIIFSFIYRGKQPQPKAVPAQ